MDEQDGARDIDAGCRHIESRIDLSLLMARNGLADAVAPCPLLKDERT
jgi:hypothetical protein